ncbi:MAG: hypothetical protein A3G34_08450 [Candidatus Lindowbacteria bacterium RIFCSPLOWO2_12_FULL_62_27]|nr:MAG: hypothetical protein A3G34_08450 [Candidatus Lindowbacteria bacterium RIFCSPLOWO2_12_FULL_62_27]OGH62929.1 MAG: hypothetical protein A3I06_13695 [Candidatus Lindowbacteria bacterium RIFCSPLOWO2_02_FULL_62_12]
MKQIKKRNWPDFEKMTSVQVVKWFDTHDTGLYIDERDIVDLEDETNNAMLNIRLSRSVKRILERLAETKGLRGASTYARQILTETAKKAA